MERKGLVETWWRGRETGLAREVFTRGKTKGIYPGKKGEKGQKFLPSLSPKSGGKTPKEIII